MGHTFKNLKVWQKGHLLVLEIYKISGKFPASEKYWLSSQVRRSAASIATNIVEGYKRKSNKEFLHFLNMADASLEETKYHIILATDLGYVKEQDSQNVIKMAEEVGRMLYGFQIKLKAYSL